MDIMGFREAISLLCLLHLFDSSGAISGGECIDINERAISPGTHYIPGPDVCTACVCDNGSPKWCQAVFCSSPPQLNQDCKSFRIGKTCCEFICLDDVLPKPEHANPELGLRLIASAISAILSLSLLFFLIHRLRQRKIRGRQIRRMTEEQRNINGIGYIAGSINYLSNEYQDNMEIPYNCDSRSNFALWKPPDHYFPRGEAPPPYEVALAAARAEAIAAAAQAEAMASALNLTVRLPPEAGVSTIAEVYPTGTISRREPMPLPTQVEIPNLSSLPPPPEPATELPADFLHAIRSDAFYEDVPITLPAPPPPLVEYVNVEQTRDPELAAAAATAAPPPAFASTEPSTNTNLTAMNELNRSTCSCPDEVDDYRSECENCKSTQGSRYFDAEPNNTPQETMTLQRRPPSLTPNTANGYGTSLTLPNHTRRLRDHRSPNLPAPFSVQLQRTPFWSDSSSSSRSSSPEQNRTGTKSRSYPRRSSVSSEGLEASTHM